MSEPKSPDVPWPTVRLPPAPSVTSATKKLMDEQQQANMQRGDDGLTYSAVYYACTFPDQPFVPATPELWPTGVTWPPTNPYPVPRAEPSGTEQELGALKHRVGLLEQQMREMVEKFKSKGER